MEARRADDRGHKGWEIEIQLGVGERYKLPPILIMVQFELNRWPLMRGFFDIYVWKTPV